MMETSSNAHIRTHRRILGRTIPRSASVYAERRFKIDRAARYAARIKGQPSDHQSALIQSLVATEWTAVRNERIGEMHTDRLALDARRLFSRLLAEFENTLKKPPPVEAPPTLAEVLAEP